jgi:hypothetical protein
VDDGAEFVQIVGHPCGGVEPLVVVANNNDTLLAAAANADAANGMYLCINVSMYLCICGHVL